MRGSSNSVHTNLKKPSTSAVHIRHAKGSEAGTEPQLASWLAGCNACAVQVAAVSHLIREACAATGAVSQLSALAAAPGVHLTTTREQRSMTRTNSNLHDTSHRHTA
jgi:hypothetical protein